jgi:hypothetical protein
MKWYGMKTKQTDEESGEEINAIGFIKTDFPPTEEDLADCGPDEKIIVIENEDQIAQLEALMKEILGE